MRYLLTPKSNMADEAWIEDVNVSLPGIFYDYLFDKQNRNIGLRYWIYDWHSLETNAVFFSFLNDERFFYNKKNGFIDIVFSCDDVFTILTGDFFADSRQDFGGDFVLKSKNTYAIAFDINVD